MSAQPDPPANSHEPQPRGAARPPRSALPRPAFHDPQHHIKIYQGDCLEILPAIPAETVDLVFADPPYFLSNDGITCHAGRMVSLNKGKWDKSRGPDLDHEFNRAWIAACQRVLEAERHALGLRHRARDSLRRLRHAATRHEAPERHHLGKAQPAGFGAGLAAKN